METNKPLVAIHCLVYNHEPYLRRCIDGFVRQRTNFPFVAIVHDDASTDRTADIIREYEMKYPDIIKPIIEKENQYSKGCLNEVMCKAIIKTGAQYVAYCEGDDYWTDSNKLQKQVDFLESYLDYSMCFHTANLHWEDGREPDRPFMRIEDRDYSGEDIFRTWTVATSSVVHRMEVLQSDVYKKAFANRKMIYGDIRIFLSCAHYGKIYGMSDTMSVYRKQLSGMVFNYSVERQKKQAFHNLEVYKVFGKKYKKLSFAKYAQDAIESFMNLRGEGVYDYKLLFSILRYTPISFFSFFCTLLCKKLKNR